MVMVMIMMIMIVVIVMIMIMKIRILVLPPNYERIIERNLDVDDVCQLPFLPLSAFQPLSGDLVQALSLFIEKFQ